MSTRCNQAATCPPVETADDDPIECPGPGCTTVIRAGWLLCPRCESIREDAIADARAELGAFL